MNAWIPRGLAAVLGALLIAAASAVSAETNEQDRAFKILEKMAETLKGSPQFAFSADVTWDMPTSTGIFLQLGQKADVLLRRANNLKVNVAGDIINREIWYDGKALTVVDPGTRTYATQDVPGSIDEALDFIMRSYGITPPLADFLYSDPFAVMTERADSGIYVGLHTVRGKRAHHLVFTQREIDWQIWISESDPPLPLRFAITYRTQPGIPRYTAVFSEWELSPQVSNDTFAFKAPDDAKRVMFVPLGK
ncbi:MAG: DUF2092 domain-containing protein [Alphaproteobacteria bacterium]|nr:DUF2092 domain-containing protein [Alphaproteobacteria bacterium]